MSTDSAFFTISNTVTPRTIEVFLMHCIRCPEVLVQARGHLEPEHFNRPGESIYRNVLSAAYEYYETHHEAPPRGVFSARIHSDVEDIPLTLPGVRGVCHQNADDLLGFIFDETQNPQSSLRPADAIAALRMILIDRTVGNAVRSLTMQSPERFDVSLLAGQIEELHAELQQIDTTFQARPVPVLGARLADYYQQLERRCGRQLLGMRTGLQQLDDHLCGIHDFLLLSAAPGVGKSVMALQMAVGVCRHSVENNNCGCALYLSMDMASTDMIDRLHCYLGGFDWKTWRLGSQDLRNQASGPRLTAAHAARAEDARQKIANWQLDTRLAIIGRDHARGITAEQIAAMARGLKQQVGAEHCLVIIDYLQLLPVPDTVARQGDLEADKYRVEIAQQVLDASKDQFDRPQDTVLAISEARKPTSSSQHHTWGTKIEDLLGSARLGYSADGVLLLRPMSDDELQDNYGSIGGDDEIRGQLSDEGISPLMITLAKGRDGMTRGSWPAEFHFQQSSISEGVPNRPGAGPISLPPRRRDAVSVSVQNHMGAVLDLEDE